MYLCRCRTRSCLPPRPCANASRRRPRRRTGRRMTSTRPPCKVNHRLRLCRSMPVPEDGSGFLWTYLGRRSDGALCCVASDRFDSTSQEVNGELSSPRAFAGSSSSSDGHLEGSSQSSSKYLGNYTGLSLTKLSSLSAHISLIRTCPHSPLIYPDKESVRASNDTVRRMHRVLRNPLHHSRTRTRRWSV